jgi:hypothetical protein
MTDPISRGLADKIDALASAVAREFTEVHLKLVHVHTMMVTKDEIRTLQHQIDRIEKLETAVADLKRQVRALQEKLGILR